MRLFVIDWVDYEAGGFTGVFSSREKANEWLTTQGHVKITKENCPKSIATQCIERDCWMEGGSAYGNLYEVKEVTVDKVEG